MERVPRIHDGLELQAIGAGLYDLFDGGATPRARMTTEWCFIMTVLDGLNTRREVREAYRQRFGRPLSEGALDAVIEQFQQLGLLNTNPRAVWALRALSDRGVRFRAGGDRRSALRTSPNRRFDSDVAHAIDRCVYLINQGQLERAEQGLSELADRHAEDLRLAELAAHVADLIDEEGQPALVMDERFPDWDAFDRALTEMLSQGRCPTCHEHLVVELGRNNHCPFCHASFTAYVLDQVHA